MTDPIEPMSALGILTTSRIRTRDQAEPGGKALEKTCRDFESLFINYLMQEMRKTIPEDSLFGGGEAEKIYSSMLDSEVSKTIAQQRSIGLATLLYEQLSSVQDTNDHTKK
jgi:Rod binding domain-containing protein